MEDENDIEVDNLGVFFRLYHQPHTTLKQEFINFFKRTKAYEEFWALRGVSFKVKKGEMFGVIGKNGSGKSTLLKILAGILIPDEGSVKKRRRISALLELGAGFNEELTGRENIFLSGSILGFKKKDIDEMYDDIVGFSELGKFIDLPIRNYSSGMCMRLGFSLATSVDPDIFIIDEILGVGDEGFQKKCLERINNFKRKGKTIILVSHISEQIQGLCDKAILLDQGRKVCEGIPKDVISEYREILRLRE
ncbi:MAG: hypothetical protein A2W05_01835 [Candidatus Schekmanbacteria bacterium RBG_16_38_10]|uniref:ABC transporter domain-containing protein n=1 Tax=Candidatus Schekmanbacteria bacterium RBG_16_38_10 TaxID=1817879 RepID=A0A1F7RXD4_9BACT|nr:MAG: hypothetical protein A2W05_01835 [Candidatus Schekmanbacteria bacterium RBG_16_38_10]